jgi:ligand-binding sensor domain-containing protein
MGSLRTTARLVAFVLVVVTGVVPTSARGSYEPLTGYSWVSLTTSVGLFPGPFRAITQDKDGYLWLGVSGDLIRFDGVRFVDAETLYHGTLLNKGVVTALCAARDGSLWVGRNIGGVSRIQGSHVTNFGLEDGLPDEDITALIEDRHGTLWVGGRQGLARFSNDRWERLGERQGLSGEGVDAIFEDHVGSLWVQNSLGTFVRSSEQKGFARAPIEAAPQSFAEDRSGAIWISDRTAGLRRLSSEESRQPRPTLVRANGTRLLYDRAGSLWMATSGQGLFRAAGLDGPGTFSIQHLGKEDGLTTDVVLSLFEDREGNVWAGTENSLVRLTRSDGISSGRNGSSSANQVTATTDGSVWIGTNEGPHRFSAKAERLYTKADGLPSNTMTALGNDPAGALWMATDRGLARFAHERFSPALLPGGFVQDRIMSLTFDRDGVLWFCNRDRGLFRWNVGGALDSFNTIPNVGSKRCLSTSTDRDGRVWIGFADGTLGLHHDSSFDVFSEHDGLTGGGVTTVYQDENGVMWVGTKRGLSRFENGKFRSFTQANGLPAKAISGVLDDERGYLWLSLISGIIRVDRREFDQSASNTSYKLHYASYDSSDGVVGVPLFLGFPNVTRGSDGRLWFVTTGGFVIVDPRQLRGSRTPPATRIESVTADGEVLDPTAGVLLPLIGSAVAGVERIRSDPANSWRVCCLTIWSVPSARCTRGSGPFPRTSRPGSPSEGVSRS